jgi:hypothetical protein
MGQRERTNRILGAGQAPGTILGAAFNGSSSLIDCGGNDFTATAVTFVLYFRFGAVTGSNIYVPIEFIDANTDRLGLALDNSTGSIIMDCGGANAFYTGGGITANTTYAMMVTKAAGTATPRMHFTTDGSAWTHTNFGATLGNPTGTITRTTIGAEHFDAFTQKYFLGEIWMVGMWAEDTTDGTCQSYLDYSVLAAKTNAQWFTNTSLINAGTVVDSGALGNNETSRANVSVGSTGLPAWITNFPPTAAAAGAPRLRSYRQYEVPVLRKRRF